MTYILIAAIIALSGAWYAQKRRTDYWKDSAMSNAKKRLSRDQTAESEKREINRKAAKKIAQLNAANEDLMDEVKRLRMINNQLWKQAKGESNGIE